MTVDPASLSVISFEAHQSREFRRKGWFEESHIQCVRVICIHATLHASMDDSTMIVSSGKRWSIDRTPLSDASISLVATSVATPALSLCCLQEIIRRSPRNHWLPSPWARIKLQAMQCQHKIRKVDLHVLTMCISGARQFP